MSLLLQQSNRPAKRGVLYPGRVGGALSPFILRPIPTQSRSLRIQRCQQPVTQSRKIHKGAIYGPA